MNQKTTTQLSSEEKKELEMLKARLAELEPESALPKKEAKKEKVKISLDEYVPVMSLVPYRLNLSTKEGGQGDTKKFIKFGEVKNIMYKDLVDIIEVQRTFMEAGFFYIMNSEVIRQHGLDEIYSKILTKEKIEEILNNTNSEQCVDLYNSANPEQQKIIVQLFISKMKESPESVNLNTVDRISRLSKIDISGKAEESKKLEEELARENKQ